MKEAPRVALVGVSGYAQIYFARLAAYAREGVVNLICATVINANEEAEACRCLQHLGCELFSDYETMLAQYRGRIDLVCVPTGIAWHMRMTIAALRNGANVLVEKPLAGSGPDSQAICAASVTANRFVAVGFQHMYDDAVLTVRLAIASGMIGQLRTIRGAVCWPRLASYYGRNGWAGRREAEGGVAWDSPLNNGMAHHLLLALHWALGADGARIVETKVELYRANAIETFDTAALQATTNTGVRLHFFASHACADLFEPFLILEGERGQIVWDQKKGRCTLLQNGIPQFNIVLRDSAAARDLMFSRVLRRLQDPAESICSAEMAALHADFVHRIHNDGRISTIASQHIQRLPTSGSGDYLVAINGIEVARSAIIERGLLPSEASIPWTL